MALCMSETAMAQDNMPMVEKTVCAEECRAGNFAAADDDAVAGKKQFTLEDLNFGGKRYREMSPKTLRLWWKGNTLVNADTLALHAAGDRGVDNDGTHQVADISRLAACGPDADAHTAQFSKQFICAVDNSTDDLAGNQHLIAADGAGHKDVVNSSHTEQVIGVHDDSVLRNSLPNAQISRLLPIEIG